MDRTAGSHLLIETANGVRLRPQATGGHVVVADQAVRARFSARDALSVLDLDCPPAGGDCARMPTVEVPAGTAVTVVARDAGVDAAGLTGDLHLTTVNGDITLASSGGSRSAVSLATRNGSIRTTDLRAATLSAATVNGDLDLTCADAPGAVDADTTNGSVRFLLPPGSPSYAVTTATDNGRAHLGLPTTGDRRAPRAALRTVNGDVTLAAGP
ncbi:DUF4097 family beta strand repeat-containing protein [Actinacidiphila acididurans]|uniref:DUF4097 family beta strand repeat protein n=1 Tax=Actinacidiphila acididurans TaxID=2784346 RepID=A0ABS2TVI0_9ACTN|nr:DUF4097 family beta strand repeat-containing protein [Actinacidiphila acididurans]MBM9507347.1 DUF4097 family beta strand repeat protein [Actinacidiphila acididurans]